MHFVQISGEGHKNCPPVVVCPVYVFGELKNSSNWVFPSSLWDLKKQSICSYTGFKCCDNDSVKYATDCQLMS